MFGLSQHNRVQRIVDIEDFKILDIDTESLLRQAESIAGFIRYYDLNNNANGYFDEFLKDLHAIKEQGIEAFKADGNLEPAQALLLTFLEQLHQITNDFNTRWKQYPFWYFNQIAKIKAIQPKGNKMCLAFVKNTNQTVMIEEGFQFTLENPDYQPLIYRLLEKVSVENIAVKRLSSLYFYKQKDVFPASEFDFVTSIKTKDLSGEDLQNDFMFGEDKNLKNSKNLGFILSSPALLLREGKRAITLTFHSEDKEWTNLLREKGIIVDEIEKAPIYNKLFYLRISCIDGWKLVENYSVKRENDKLILKFTLLEDFPETMNCTPEIHSFESQFPALKIYLNYDAWLYPYSWMKHFSLNKIRIKTKVFGISNVSVYNELGKIDCSKPFSPFGINTEKGASITIGNYEMAAKNTQQITVKINWEQLPADDTGLQGYYADYQKNINNRSFVVQARYLSDYQWKNAQEYYLFSSTPNFNDESPVASAPLTTESIMNHIVVEKMSPTKVAEESYDYHIHAKTGFVSFVLKSPDIGFGEKYYRTLFADYLIQKSIKKNKKQNIPNAPIIPVIERITLSYEAEDTIDLRAYSASNENTFFHVSPFGNEKKYPNTENNAIPIIFSMEPEANLLIALADVKGGELLSLYLDFASVKKEISSEIHLPEVCWYWGNGYQWQKIPDGYITEDKTENLLVSGFLNLQIPENIDDSLFTDDGILWLRAGIVKNEQVVPSVKRIYINIGEAVLDLAENIDILDNFNHNSITGKVKPEKSIPGVEQIIPVAFYGGREKENTLALAMRVSEYISHKGIAVTVRDFERMTLQAFPDIAKVKCLPNYNAKSEEKNVVTLVVVPQKTKQDSAENWLPMATSRQIFGIEAYFRTRTSALVNHVDVINPSYEEIMIRCHVNFKKRYSTVACRTSLVEKLNSFIAPWQKNNGLPEFDYNFSVEEVYQLIIGHESVEEIKQLSIIQMIEHENRYFSVNEYENEKDIIKPSKPFAVFVPAKEHIILTQQENFGINEMTITENFIIS